VLLDNLFKEVKIVFNRVRVFKPAVFQMTILEHVDFEPLAYHGHYDDHGARPVSANPIAWMLTVGKIRGWTSLWLGSARDVLAAVAT
jgi:hypothetical protein